MKKEPIYVLLENPSPGGVDVESVRRSPRRSKCRWPFRKPKLPETAILALLIWGIAVLSAYDKVGCRFFEYFISPLTHPMFYLGFARTWWLRRRMRSQGSIELFKLL